MIAERIGSFTPKASSNRTMSEYHRNLPRKWMSAAALIFNDEGNILIVKPTYKPGWELPGGGIDEEESPLDALKRELREELGLHINPGSLLCVEYVPNFDNRGDRIQFVFDGGVLSRDAAIKLPQDELSAWKFASLKESLTLLGHRLHKRVPAAVQAHVSRRTIYLESYFESEK